MIIDIHTHTFPDKIAAGAIRSMEGDILRSQGLEVHAPGKGTFDDLSNSSIINGVDLTVVAPVATKPAQAEKINRLSVDINERCGETHVFYFGAIHPDCQNYKQIIDDIVSMDLRAIKLHPDYQSTFFDDEKYVRIIDYAAEKGLGILVHAGEDIGLPEVIHCSPDRILRVLKHVQPEKLILAHMGGWRMWDEVEEKLVGLPVYFDTAVVLKKDVPHLDSQQFARIVRNHGVEKILFGTDSPWYDQGQALEDFRNVMLTEEENRKILGENANRLFKFM